MSGIRGRTALMILVVAVGCAAPASPAATPAPAGLTPPAQGTVALPPAYTATPQPSPTPTRQPTPTLAPLDPSAGLLPDFGQAPALDRALTRYWIDVGVEMSSSGRMAAISGTARIEFTNRSADPLREVPVMLWPNDPQYEAGMRAGPVRIGDRLAEVEALLDGLAMSISLPGSLLPGEKVLMEIPFELEIGPFPAGAPRRMGITRDVLLVPTFYPLIPPLGEDGWQVEAAPPGGDTTNSETALYDLSITAPADLALAVSGVEVDRKVAGARQTVRVLSGPMRDVAFALGPFQVAERQAGQVTLRAWLLPDHLEEQDVVLDAAAGQLALLEELVGPYPYPELDIVDSPGAFGGIEYPGLIFIGTLGTPWVVEPVVHEVAHQWFYALIGDDQIHEPWLDEALATYATSLYYERAYGSGRATGYLSDLRSVVRAHPRPETPIGLGVGEYASEEDYAIFVYFKGALFLDALRHAIGEEAFQSFLRSYYQSHRFDVASSTDFQDAAEHACACDLDALFDLWVYKGGELPELAR